MNNFALATILLVALVNGAFAGQFECYMKISQSSCKVCTMKMSYNPRQDSCLVSEKNYRDSCSLTTAKNECHAGGFVVEWSPYRRACKVTRKAIMDD